MCKDAFPAIYFCVSLIRSVHEGQKKAWDSLELDKQKVSCYVDSGRLTLVLWKSSLNYLTTNSPFQLPNIIFLSR